MALGAKLDGVRIFLTFDAEKSCKASKMITSKLTRKAQTTIPQPVRTALHLQAGEEIVYHIEGNRVFLTRAVTDATEDPFGAFREWHSDADSRAYADL